MIKFFHFELTKLRIIFNLIKVIYSIFRVYQIVDKVLIYSALSFFIR